MTKRLTVLVTGVGGRSVGYQILQALLLLKEKYRIIATDAAPFSYGLYAVPERYVVPSARSPDYIPALLRIVRQEGVDVILPGTQPEVLMIGRHRETFESLCAVIVNPTPVVELCSEKQKLYEWLEANGFAIPKTVLGRDWRDLVAKCGFPIVAKPTQDTGGSRGVAILNDEPEVDQYLRDLPVEQTVFQEYVGSAESEYTVGIMVSPQGELIDSIVLQRTLVGFALGTQRTIGNQTYTLSTGYSQGVIIKHPAIQATCEDLALKIGIRGPSNIQLRLHQGKVIVFEVHPRFSGTTSIRAGVGFNEPDVLIRSYLLAEKFGRLDYQTDVAAIRAFSNLLVPMNVLRTVPRA